MSETPSAETPPATTEQQPAAPVIEAPPPPGEPPIAPLVVAAVLWLGIYLREPRLRTITPLRK